MPPPPSPAPSPDRPAQRHRTVVARHTLPDGSWHLDWMIDRVGGREAAGDGEADHRDLVTFRVMVRPDDPVARVFDGERISDHRAAYLTREGDIGEGRGSVARVAGGWCTIDRLDGDALDLTFDLGRGPRRVSGRRTGRAMKPDDRPGTVEDWRFAVREAPGR